MLLNENGILDIDSIIVNNESYKKIIEDNVITEAVSQNGRKIIVDAELAVQLFQENKQKNA